MKSPTLARLELSRRLSSRRKRRGHTVDEVVKHLGFSRNYFSAVENERTLLAEDKLDLLLELYDFDPSDRKHIKELSKAARRRSRWVDFREVLGDDAVQFFGLEDGAEKIRVFESILIPGLLQLPEYTRSVVSIEPSISQVHLERVVHARQLRQERLRNGAVEFVALLSEAALRQQWGGAALQVRQLLSLADQVERNDNLVIRVLPFDRPSGTIAGSSTLVELGFDSEYVPHLIYQEAVRSLTPIEPDDDDFLRLRLAFDDGLHRSLSPPESLDLIRHVAASIK